MFSDKGVKVFNDDVECRLVQLLQYQTPPLGVLLLKYRLNVYCYSCSLFKMNFQCVFFLVVNLKILHKSGTTALLPAVDIFIDY